MFCYDSNAMMLGKLCIMRKLEVLLFLLCVTGGSVAHLPHSSADLQRALANETVMTVATPSFSPDETT